jgi:hypothetical protein
MSFTLSNNNKIFRSLKLGAFKVTIQKKCLVINKADSPYHLTLCFNQRLNGIDIHFKNDSESNEIVKRYLLKLEDIEIFFNETLGDFSRIALELRKKYWKRINIGKLHRQGYGVLLPPDEEIVFKRLLRGNRHSSRTIVLSGGNIAKRLRAIIGHVYHPAVLYEIPIEKMDKPFQLVAFKKKSQKKNRMLFVLIENDSPKFYIAPFSSLNAMMEGMQALIPQTAFAKAEEFKKDFENYFGCDRLNLSEFDELAEETKQLRDELNQKIVPGEE